MNSDPFVVLAWCAVAGFGLLMGGCGSSDPNKAVLSPSVRVVDAEDGNDLDDLLLITVHSQTSPFLRDPIIAGGPYPSFKPVSAQLCEFSSRSRISRPNFADTDVLTKDGVRSQWNRVEYYFIREGYTAGAIDDDSLAQAQETGRPIVIQVERVGSEGSDIRIAGEGAMVARDVLPHLPVEHPLRARLLDILIARLELITDADLSSESTKAALQTLREARSRQHEKDVSLE